MVSIPILVWMNYIPFVVSGFHRENVKGQQQSIGITVKTALGPAALCWYLIQHTETFPDIEGK